MNTIEGRYLGELRCEMTHQKSLVKIHTDAPTDNNGKGESFSPTDLVAAALGSCMLTIIAIRAKAKRIEIGTPTYSIVKTMESNPRMIKEVQLKINFKQSISEADRLYIEKEALSCPVALSLNKDLFQNVSFIYA